MGSQEIASVPVVGIASPSLNVINQIDFVEMHIEGTEWEVLPELLPRLRKGCSVYFEAHNVAEHQAMLTKILEARPTDVHFIRKIGAHALVLLTVH
jgi:hypothetical protein